ncbi:thioredoxin domain-containing protein [Mobiluncus mulieris]|uniref:Uncharacterized protein n=2 Tax=Mobiluncus mulieris TaxID=2052 RepID=E0QRJ4_9ACTO|nr:thioredoxin domain-containing protein [Mobiluncus mulieris]EFM45702.1 hypothetical protein HMPREF0580_1509 [Mobiluncus mulieris ATCC 35239]MCU9970217.1 thioredoxin domain-containing protein [Mobiluncus mulieris]MCU9974680.1 thioredoxin domain-containing protein [Mobiluncus mulieris]MCU9993705.1 thioredoxin domain-containing protein [Mobiluncus mulieris]MCV0013016.1 thioredoxin domain-containing protein [Mobiluncus mulieris]
MGKTSNKKIVVSNPNNAGHARTVMIIVIVALVLALALAAVVIVTKKRAAVSQPDGTIANTASLTGYAEPTEYSQGKGLWFKHGKLLSDEEIASEAAKGTKVLEYYFDYTCNICNDVDEKLNQGKQLEDLAEAGKALLVLRPTLTHNAPFAHVANNLIYWVAKNQPEKTWKLSKALTHYAMNTYKTADFQNNKNNSKWINEATNPEPVVKRIAEENGIDYSQVPAASPESGQISIDIYAKQRMAKLGENSAGTPLYIANGKILKLGGVKLSDKLLENATL